MKARCVKPLKFCTTIRAQHVCLSTSTVQLQVRSRNGIRNMNNWSSGACYWFAVAGIAHPELDEMVLDACPVCGGDNQEARPRLPPPQCRCPKKSVCRLIEKQLVVSDIVIQTRPRNSRELCQKTYNTAHRGLVHFRRVQRLLIRRATSAWPARTRPRPTRSNPSVSSRSPSTSSGGWSDPGGLQSKRTSVRTEQNAHDNEKHVRLWKLMERSFGFGGSNRTLEPAVLGW